ncbi:MAG: transketolase [Candidatus Atribacteria bacterium]|nr:transketolase [Candidatus Atribacteria bacterium]
MRSAFVTTLIERAKQDKDIYLLTGDLGFSVFERFKKEFPTRFIDCGVAEQNMIGVAAGLALSGKKVIVYSIIPFINMRCFEQIRNDICLHNLDIKIVGVGAGFSYGAQGPTHHALEDLAIMRPLPNIQILCPVDSTEAKLATQEMLKVKGPFYLRLEKEGEENIYSKEFRFKIGKANMIKSGKDITIIGLGSILNNAILAAQKIEEKYHISIRIISMTTLKPLDNNIILKAARETKAIFTIEEHSMVGGLGSAVADILAEAKSDAYFKKIAVPDRFVEQAGSQNYLRDKNGLSVQTIQNIIGNVWKSIINIR